MFRVLSCLGGEHDWRLVSLACIVSLLAGIAAISVVRRAWATRGVVRVAWTVTAGAATGCGVWATHFIALLAYDPGVGTGYGIRLTVLSCVAAVALAGGGLAVAVYGRAAWRAPAGGAIIGVGVACTHYLGMWALTIPGHVTWSADLVVASVVLGVLLAMGALTVAMRHGIVAKLAAALLLGGAILSLHFTAMGAILIVLDPGVAVDAATLPASILAIAVAGIASAILGVSLVAALMDRLLSERTARLDTTLNKMSQGVLMYDDDMRLVVCNDRYLEMYGLSRDIVKPGRTLREIIGDREQSCGFRGDPDRFVDDLLAAVAEGRLTRNVVETVDGRRIAIVVQPMAGGGWITTHEDITAQWLVEKAQAERAAQEARTANEHLRDAFEAVPEGLALFDAEDRYVLWNSRYAQLCECDGIANRRGMRFEDALRTRLALGHYPEAVGREEEWLADRLERHRRPHHVQEQQDSDGRWLRIEERRTADGGTIGAWVDITELKHREASFRLMFEANPAPMWIFAVDTLAFLAVNNAAVDQYGYGRDQFLAMTLLDIRPREDWEALRQAVNGAGKGRVERSWRHIRADGSEIDVCSYACALTHEGRSARIAAMFDVTERKRAENELRRTRAFLDTVIENVPAMLFVKELREQRYVLMNRAGEQLLGIARADLIGKNDHDLYPAHEADAFTARDREIFEGRRLEIIDEEPIHTPHNGVRLVTTKRLAILGETGEPQYLLGVAEDITERKRAEERIAHLAHFDVLTDLPNRSAFTQELARTLAHATEHNESFAILFLDLDRFKEANDVFGHAVGDALLQEVARRLQTAAEGAFVARLGGDEFTLILGGAQPAATEALAERLIAALASDIVIEEQRLHTGVTIGVAIFPHDGTDASTLLGNADAALYRAKAEARGSIRFFEADMDMRLRERRALQTELQSAIAHGELTLLYQPQARIGGETTTFEALVRWRHPTRGLMAPATFIPIAEEGGLIIPMGEWILREACREAATWPLPLRIAVNLSPVQFRHGDLPGLVHTVLLETGLAANRLELEITEAVLVDDFSRAMSILRRLKDLGVRIAIDDFGTGYSSLSYLQSFPFDKIKIDRTFISDVERSPQSAAIVRSVIGLARGLDLPVVAEGVETDDQLEFLTREACNEVQGYFVGRPAPIAQYDEIVGRGARAKPPIASVA